MSSSLKQLTTSDLRKLIGVITVSVVRKKKLEVLRSVLFAIATEGKKKNSTFSLRP